MISQTSATMRNSNHLACMEGKDELCFISSAGRNQRVSCNIFGKIFSTNTRKGWEVWRFSDLQDGQVVVSSWTHHNKVLCSNPEGEVYTTENKKGDWERWVILKKSSDGVLIQSVSHDRVLCINDKGHLRTVPANDLSTSPENCLWSLDPGHCGKFFITNKACSRRISCNQHFDLYFSKNRKAWEAWTLEKFEFGGISVKSEAHGQSRYLACTKEGRVTTIGNAGYSVWTVLQSPEGGVSFLHAPNKLLLSCTEDGNLAMKAVDGDDCKVSPSETWILEPDITGTIFGPRIWGLAGVGAVGLASAIAAPFAVVGAISAIGFEAGGIAAGSMAAGMMSAEAIAAGGGVVAGGTVATLQSIGAAGLSVAGATAASTGGAVLGAGVAAASAAGVSKLSAKEEKNTTSEARQEEATNRPFASWRSWDVKNE